MGVDVGVISANKWRKVNYPDLVTAQQTSYGPSVIRLVTTKEYGSIAQDIQFPQPMIATGFCFFARIRIAADNEPALSKFTGRLYLWDLGAGEHNWTEFDIYRGPGWHQACVHLDGTPYTQGDTGGPTELRQNLRAEIYLLTMHTAIEVTDTEFGVEANSFSEDLVAE
jgi:hypothetical protein